MGGPPLQVAFLTREKVHNAVRGWQEWNTVNQNIAIAYASYRYACFISPDQCVNTYQGALEAQGLKLTTTRDPSTPAGIGNLAGMRPLYAEPER